MIDRFIIVRRGAVEVRVPITNCFWCASLDGAICALCAKRANNARDTAGDATKC